MMYGMGWGGGREINVLVWVKRWQINDVGDGVGREITVLVWVKRWLKNYGGMGVVGGDKCTCLIVWVTRW